MWKITSSFVMHINITESQAKIIMDPFEKVYVDHVGPWLVHIRSDAIQEIMIHKIHILTKVDGDTNRPERAIIPTTNSHSCAKKLPYAGLSPPLPKNDGTLQWQ